MWSDPVLPDLCPPGLSNLPQHHHVERVVGEAGDERRQRDDDDDGDEEVRAAVGTRRGPGFLPRVREASAVGVELQREAAAA